MATVCYLARWHSLTGVGVSEPINCCLQILWAPVGLTMRLCASLGRCVHTCMWKRFPSQELQHTVNSEVENRASVPFFIITWLVEAFWHLDNFGQADWRNFIVSLAYVLFYIWKLVTIHYNCLRDYCNTFFLWNSSSVLWMEKIQPTFYQHESK